MKEEIKKILEIIENVRVSNEKHPMPTNPEYKGYNKGFQEALIYVTKVIKFQKFNDHD